MWGVCIKRRYLRCKNKITTYMVEDITKAFRHKANIRSFTPYQQIQPDVKKLWLLCRGIMWNSARKSFTVNEESRTTLSTRCATKCYIITWCLTPNADTDTMKCSFERLFSSSDPLYHAVSASHIRSSWISLTWTLVEAEHHLQKGSAKLSWSSITDKN